MTVTALMVAVAGVLLYLASFAPTGRLALCALAGLAVAASAIEGGLGWGLGCWAGGTFVGLILVPDKSGGVLFTAFFGIYPVLKSLLERQKSRPLEWLGKFLFFNLALTLCWLCWRWGFMEEALLEKWALWLIYAAGNVVFFVYDIAFSRLISLYITRVAAKRNRK